MARERQKQESVSDALTGEERLGQMRSREDMAQPFWISDWSLSLHPSSKLLTGLRRRVRVHNDLTPSPLSDNSIPPVSP